MKKKIAVVIRHHSSRRQFLHRILESLKNQSFKNIILCVLNMDDKAFESEFYNTSSVEELFIYLDSENVDYISILDDDDSIAPDFFNRTQSVLDKVSREFTYTKAIAVHINKVFELCEGNRIRITRTEPLNHHLPYGILALDVLRYRDTLRTCACLFDYKSIRDIVYNHNIKHPSFFWPFIIEFGSKFDIWMLGEAMAFYHIREISEFNSSNFSLRDMFNSENYIRDKLNKLYRSSNSNVVLSDILQKIILP